MQLICGDNREVLPTLPSGSVDVILTDPPYPCIKRSYGTWTEAEWWEMMRAVVPECMRVLKPHGSAVFILQPNSERVGRMRTWLWEFMVWVGKEWGIVQDAWWWNIAAMPEYHAIQGKLLRPSVKACIWIGQPDCWRNQDAVLWDEADLTKAWRQAGRADKDYKNPSGHHQNYRTMVAAIERRGGVSPFNLLPFPNADSTKGGGAFGHPASTPTRLAGWWLRYICPPGGTVLDPFSGTATVGIAALQQGKDYVGVERIEEYHQIAQNRLAGVQKPQATLFDNEAPHESQTP